MKSDDIECENNCPVRKAAEIIEGKWTTLIFRELISGKKRYSELKKALDGVSPKVLSARLRLLAENDLLKRTVFPTVPPTTEYEITELGLQFKSVLASMTEFGQLLLAKQETSENSPPSTGEQS